MKIKNFHRAAFFNLRVVVASLSCLTAVMLVLFACLAIARQSENQTTTNSSSWLTRLASKLGIEARSPHSANVTCSTCARTGGGAALLIQQPEEREPKGWLRHPRFLPTPVRFAICDRLQQSAAVS